MNLQRNGSVPALQSLILTGQIGVAVENRAFKEGLLDPRDFALSDFAVAKPMRPQMHEDTALDLVCLYDTLVVDRGRFDLEELNRFADRSLVRNRPDIVREFTLRQDPKFDFGPIHLFGTPVDLRPGEFEALKRAATYEAGFLLTRDLNGYLADARAAYEAQVVLPAFADPFGAGTDIPDDVLRGFFRRNLAWLLSLFEDWFAGGVYNNILDVEDLELADLSQEQRRQLRFVARSDRFRAYFEHLQDAYTNLYDNSFLGRCASVELAYERAPDRRLPAGEDADAITASRVLRVNLADVVDHFPLARTLEEAFEIREHPRVKAFRAELARWLDAVTDEPELEARIRRDLQTANRDLERLARLKSLKQHPLVFGLKTTASLVPVLGSVITGIDVIEYFYERHVDRRAAWLVTPRDRLD